MGCSSVLVTDYSSVYFDYLLSGKPVVFFCYDLEEYLRDERAMYFSYKGYTPGRKAFTYKGLESALLEALGGSGAFQDEREAMVKKMFQYGREEACPALAGKIKVLAGDGTRHRRYRLYGRHAEKQL